MCEASTWKTAWAFLLLYCAYYIQYYTLSICQRFNRQRYYIVCLSFYLSFDQCNMLQYPTGPQIPGSPARITLEYRTHTMANSSQFLTTHFKKHANCCFSFHFWAKFSLKWGLKTIITAVSHGARMVYIMGANFKSILPSILLIDNVIKWKKNTA